MKVINEAGRVFSVKVIRNGEKYGLNDSLRHDSSDPLVEFYDFTYANQKTFGPLGQFVTRYSLSTLREGADVGVILHGGEPGWTISAINRREAILFASAANLS